MRARPFHPLAVLVAALLSLASPAASQDFPRLGMYGSMLSDGRPFIHLDGTLDYPLIDAVSRYHMLLIDVAPITPYRPDLVQEMRSRNPNLRIVGYVQGANIWYANQPDSGRDYPTRYWHMVRNNDAFLYNTRGEQFSLCNVNIAKRVGGKFVIADSIADLFHEVVYQSGSFDGMFLDLFCPTLAWANSPAESIDFRRAGYNSLGEFDAAWSVAADSLGDRLRRLVGPDFPLIGNCAQGTNYESFNGWMRENFPFQNGGNWYQNMFRATGGYLVDDLNFRSPPVNWLSSVPADPTQPDHPQNTRKVRFGLGSAALGEGYSAFNMGDRSWQVYPYFTWWYDEYAVDLATGRSTTSATNAGWLGQPLGPYTQMVWVGPQPDAVMNNDFESDVTTAWSFFSTQGSTRTRDASTAVTGSASVKIHVPAAGTPEYATSFVSTGTLPVTAGLTYSATFWAKASQPRSIRLVAATNPGSVAYRDIGIDTTWRQYQVSMIPGASANAGLGFYLAQADGDVWLDDVHFQYGATSLYRRDFQNGIVLVNPSNVSLTAPLEREYRKILGTMDPVVNDGALVTQVTVPASDALFLIGDDRIPPAAIQDLLPLNPPGPSPLRSRPSTPR